MESLLNHPSFPQPDDNQLKVWRYVSLTKFLDFAFSNCLYFSRVDCLEDNHEGTYTRINFENRFKQSKLPSGLIITREDYTKRLKQSHHVNCWRIDNYESEAMWKLYCPNNEGLAIQTTYEKLTYSLPNEKHLFMGKITYLDYEKESFDLGNNFNPIMHKRIAFEHEKEIRIVKACINYMNDHTLPIPETGIKIKTNLFQNIENVFVNPFAEMWYKDLVKYLFKKLNLSIQIKWSEIKSNLYY